MKKLRLNADETTPSSIRFITNVASSFINLIPKASKFYAATALMNEYGSELIKQLPSTCERKLLLGIDLPTPYNIFKDLAAIPGIALKVFENSDTTFHPKVYLLHAEDKWLAFVGSANFTKGGFENNIEMTACICEDQQVSFLLEWFDSLFIKSTLVDKTWLDEYETYCKEREDLDHKRRALLKKFKGRPRKLNPLSNYNFQGQFFQFIHHDAFSGRKPWDRSSSVVKERMKVSDRLYDLHEIVFPRIQKNKWNIEPHYMPKHIVSSTEHGEHTKDELDAIWLSYNRPEKEVKKLISLFGEMQTPLYQMRLQVLVRVNNVAVHLTVGKDGGGWRERAEIQKMINESPAIKLSIFHKLLINLPQRFYINVGDVSEQANSFQSVDDLQRHLAKDNIEKYYFFIGTKYKPDDKRISTANIANTVMEDFEQLMPIYNFLNVPVPK